ncbi:RagB/SusD family nutrient uptake outer membrane protein [Zobellia galactanivorans]|uniref:RagB/SusD family nutrient uptake outer membrane protein n=1 Tax=Zobellia galactanivorans (strain DSM 12802 / CCUG 47099 / CIP 106680 / NCIMB 13871 / Dsij) TaxID=63186 RepID=UPI0026E2A32F|nr:RagB/SusD family nutrient uptake outer membrane protein [Zobellia galactanivorans]MDO6810506.1 RagB/SusD family nutrient uptake outer membrane protein [Zobellia galactanivorans]
MKKYLYILIVVMTLVVTSCEKELIQNPNTSKVADNFYTNETELEEAVNAVFATLQLTGVYNTAMPAVGELPGEDAYDETPANDGGVYGMLDDFNVIPQSELIADVWEDSYQGIQRANIVINRIQDIEFAEEATKDARKGEMLFIRAMLYFNLVRTFGDVPLVIDEVANPQDYFGQTRTPVSEVYLQIISDLDEAVGLLPVRNDDNKGRVVKTAAQTLLGKVYLTLKDYAKAKSYLDAVVESKSHKLIAADQVFSLENELNDELIFVVQYASGLSSNTEGSDAYRMFNPTGRVEENMTGTKGHGVLKPDFYALYTEADARKDVYVKTLESGLAFNNKIAVPTTVVADSNSDWVVLRYADVLLMLAEIENELGNGAEAIDYLDEVRNRANLGDYTGATDKESVFGEIDLQRRLELVWEGHRWFDLLRQGRAKSVLGITDDSKLLLPLPASQIAADPALIQNPGY